jgi:hypothetical protein
MLLLGLAVLLLPGCVTPTVYVSRALGDVPAEKKVKVADPQPVQLLFEFQTKGSFNSQATSFLQNKVEMAVQSTEVFSQTRWAPVPNGTVLSIKINNIVLTDNASAAAFMTGFTFGLAGSNTTDGYVCTLEYLPGPGQPKITKEVRHAIHTSIGNTDPPINSLKAPNVEQAIYMVTRQLVSHGVNQLASGPPFRLAASD